MPISNAPILLDDVLGDVEADARYQAIEGGKKQKMQEAIKDHEGRLGDWWYQSRVYHAENRQEMATDEDFADGIQWTEEDKAVLQERGQAPLVFNECKPAIEWICGTERRSRVDWKVHPRTDEDRVPAERKTKLLKYLSDVNRAPWHRSRAFREAATAGLGWIETGIRGNADREPLFVRSESWRNMWYDPISREFDLSDARFLHRARILDLDVAGAMFPWAKETILKASGTLEQIASHASDDFFESQLYYDADASHTVVVADALSARELGRRRVIPMVETWYRIPAQVQIVRGWDRYDGLEYDETNGEMKEATETGDLILFNAIRMRMRCAVGIEDGQLLQDLPTPYRHQRYPFVPVWGYRRARDGKPYGVLRNARDPQEDLNKRRSKALYILSSNRVIMDEDAVDEEEHGNVEEIVADPSGVIRKKRGSDFTLETDRGLAREHVEMGIQDSEYIRQTSGVTGENLGLESNATSGKAIMARQNQGSVVTTTLFDNLRLAIQISGELQLSNVEQFYSWEKVIRITNERGKPEFVNINGANPETGELEDPITASQADFIVEETPFHETVRQAMFEQMSDMVAKQPAEIAIQLLDMVFELSDLPGKDAMVARIRQINGQSDPDEPDDPAMIQKRMEQERQQQEQAALAMRDALSTIEEREAKTAKTQQEAQRAALENLSASLQTALESLQAPALAPTADTLLQEAAQSSAPKPAVPPAPGLVQPGPPPLVQ
jgi:hypothetical protein